MWQSGSGRGVRVVGGGGRGGGCEEDVAGG